jgi:hypothetical protein
LDAAEDAPGNSSESGVTSNFIVTHADCNIV